MTSGGALTAVHGVESDTGSRAPHRTPHEGLRDDGRHLPLRHAGLLTAPPSGLRVEPEDPQLLVAAAGLRDARGPRDGLLARGQLEDGEAAVEWGRPRIAALGDRAVGRDTCGGTASSMPPPKTYTPAAFASSITACASRPTASHSPSGTTIAALGKEIRYFAMGLSLRGDGDETIVKARWFLAARDVAHDRWDLERLRDPLDTHVLPYVLSGDSIAPSDRVTRPIGWCRDDPIRSR